MMKKGGFYRFLKKIVYFFYGKREFVGLENIPNGPAIIVGNHSQIHGPIIAELLYPFPKKTWCIGQVMNKAEFPAYAMEDFWPYKKKAVRWFYKILSRALARPLTYIFTNADCIGVYKDARIANTLRYSVKTLKEGKHLIIYPESHTPYNEIVNEFQHNFVEVARIYARVTGENIPFVPMYVCPKLKKVIFGLPIYYDQNISIDENKQVIISYLKTAITEIAKELPRHKVVPFSNISKKKYPMSK